ncbi:iron ABC transporter permease [Pseudomonas lalucatii]|uniref:Iron ABC transporter permease n=1 Tax=Pseudomonas lalucatii TaxID=1424203 RepID=A0ABS5Q3B9_9PSED|nr:lipocalin-like domain-containing protein [Pseudomonas lalucatii]MBS7663242.1 iron ABC transporter permease [Pseudomonas lalucatii]MBS7689934.1 iron ABC transporter permease [Pseudomonas lalucatii]QVM87112.1 iron ABC transporter permease [Pseudomonas lalucatii]
MNARGIGLALAGLLLACDGQSPSPQGFAGLGSGAEAFAQVEPGRPLVFPADHGAHPDYRIEWWYLTANLRDRQGRSWGLQWTLFRNALRPGDSATGWDNRTLWMGHAALTGPDGHRFAETFARGGIGQAGVEATPLHAWIDDWQLRSLAPQQDGLGELQLRARGRDFAYRLRLSSDQGPVLHGRQGYSQKSGQGQASYYYSQPFLRAVGEVELDGQASEVEGLAWLDREWSSQPLAADQLGWDWFSLHLDSGDKLMLFQLRHADGRHYRAGTWIGADGSSQALEERDIRLTPTGFARVAGRRMPIRWTLQVAAKGLAVDTAPLQDDSWMATRFPYWEGPIRFAGSHSGVGYLEMTGY